MLTRRKRFLFVLSTKQTRITTRYSIKPAKSRTKLPQQQDKTATSPATTSDAASEPPRGSLVITTYDPVTGVNLKYRTTKAAEVTRLVQATLGRLGRCMAALPLDVKEEPMPDASAAKLEIGTGGGSGTATPVSQVQPPQQQGGKKKKKTGRK